MFNKYNLFKSCNLHTIECWSCITLYSQVAKIILKQDISEIKCPKYDKQATIAAVRSLSISRQAILEVSLCYIRFNMGLLSNG